MKAFGVPQMSRHPIMDACVDVSSTGGILIRMLLRCRFVPCHPKCSEHRVDRWLLRARQVLDLTFSVVVVVIIVAISDASSLVNDSFGLLLPIGNRCRIRRCILVVRRLRCRADILPPLLWKHCSGGSAVAFAFAFASCCTFEFRKSSSSKDTC